MPRTSSTSKPPSRKSVRRLSIYRRILLRALGRGQQMIRSRELAQRAGVSAAQVRRDIMSIGYSGSPNRGYECKRLYDSIGEYLGMDRPITAVLVGVGNIGRAVLGYFAVRSLNVQIDACFDADEDIIHTDIHGCRCYSVNHLGVYIVERKVTIGILAVPFRAAQATAQVLVDNGITGILNFTPATLKVPEHVFVEDIDITAALETISYFAESRQMD